ncbi:hypothetical protein BASA81_006460 [Batrachochytrium salamandrivorans]|nr:hypothetical protein BASA81_006460 [Batrachochytrium salamandrivorans]
MSSPLVGLLGLCLYAVFIRTEPSSANVLISSKRRSCSMSCLCPPPSTPTPILDWEIFHLVLTDLARRGLTVLAIQFDDNNVLTIKLSRKAAALNNRVLEVFVTHLNGTLNEECIEIAFQSSHPLLFTCCCEWKHSPHRPSQAKVCPGG